MDTSAQELLEKQRNYFLTNETKNLRFRIAQLKKLKALLKANEEELNTAIWQDFGKSAHETYKTELSLVYHEINVAVRKLPVWAKKKKVRTNLANFPGSSYLLPEPYGCTLIIGAWNYPYQLTLNPLVAALAAGNTAIVKPSELASHSSAALARLLNGHFPPEYLRVVEGGVKETTALLDLRFDKIFFTGSIPVGKIVYQAAAKHLTPVTLELGGKSPVFVLPDCNLKHTARRLVWAKFLNAGQTCIAPDYVLVHRSQAAELLQALQDQIESLHLHPGGGDLPENYTRIINRRHFDRLCSLIHPDQVYYGGTPDLEHLYLPPTLLHRVSFDDKVMEDEIFGPLLPVLAFDDLGEIIEVVRRRPKPLALYVFSENKKAIDQIFANISFGGGAVNDSVLHIANGHLPFGGVGESGTGSYHYEAGFKTFSHFKGILQKPSWFDPFVLYPPYTKGKRRLLQWLLE